MLLIPLLAIEISAAQRQIIAISLLLLLLLLYVSVFYVITIFILSSCIRHVKYEE